MDSDWPTWKIGRLLLLFFFFSFLSPRNKSPLSRCLSRLRDDWRHRSSNRQRKCGGGGAGPFDDIIGVCAPRAATRSEWQRKRNPTLKRQQKRESDKCVCVFV
jgi:hypothetical protein